MLRRTAAAAAAVSLLLALSACGDDEADGPTTPSTGASQGEVKTIEVTIEDGVASTAGERVDVGVDEPVDLVVTADTDGELHVHSTPEQFLEFKEGTNDPFELQIDRPGIIEIELHEPTEGPVVELQVQ